MYIYIYTDIIVYVILNVCVSNLAPQKRLKAQTNSKPKPGRWAE